jgi:hypothetical protein
MALPLEEAIMREIGLENNYRWYNGSGSCGAIRRVISDKLVQAIKKHHEAGDPIAAPHPTLMALMREASQWDHSPFVLTIAWQVASDIIRAHMDAHFVREDQRDTFLIRSAQVIRTIYQDRRSDPWLPPGRENSREGL